MDLHVLAQGTGMGVRLATTPHAAQVRLVRRMHVHVLLAVAAVGEAPVTAFNLALEGFLSCGGTWEVVSFLLSFPPPSP